MCFFVVFSILLTCMAVSFMGYGGSPIIWLGPILMGYLPIILILVIRKRRLRKFWEMHENSVMNATVRAHAAMGSAENIKKQAEEAWSNSNHKNRDFDLTIEQCYAFFGVDKNATMEQIKAIYKELMIEFHPDKHKTHKKHYEEHCQKINYAYEKICKERDI